MPRTGLAAVLASSAAAASVLAFASPASAAEVKGFTYDVGGASYVGNEAGLSAPGSLYTRTNGSLSAVNVWPGQGGVGEKLVLSFPTLKNSDGTPLATSNGVPINGECASAQIQSSPKTSVGTGTATILCDRVEAGGVSQYMIVYGFSKPSLNCVKVSATRIEVPNLNCPASISGKSIINGVAERSGVGGNVASASLTAVQTAAP